ncbi:MAG: hypothetical protein WBD55_00875, partial [Dehalococcoidia bacterium]
MSTHTRATELAEVRRLSATTGELAVASERTFENVREKLLALGGVNAQVLLGEQLAGYMAWFFNLPWAWKQPFTQQDLGQVIQEASKDSQAYR